VTYLSNNGHLGRLYIGGRRIPSSEIIGEVVITRNEGDAAQLTAKLNPSSGSQDLNLFRGKSVIFDVQTSSGIQRMFTGIVDIDEYDIQREFIMLRCNDNRRQLVENLTTVINNIGFYSTEVFGNAPTKNRELENRLTTTPSSLDFDQYGNYHLTSWTPKGSADYTLSDSDVYVRSVKINRTNRANLLNKVNIDVTHTYQRLHHREVSYSWSNGVTICDFLIFGHSLAQREMIRDAAEAAGWPIKGNISYTDVYPSGLYRCTDIFTLTKQNIGWLGPGGGLDGSGIPYNPNQPDVVDGSSTLLKQYDRAGNEIWETAANQTINASNLLCIGASWVATTRFAQNMKENYTLTVTAPQSTSDFGTIQQDESITINSEFNSADWENYVSYQDKTEGTFIDDSAGNPTTSYYIDKDVNRSGLNTSINVLLNKAKTSILKTHRQNKVTFSRSLWPEIDLRHTVSLSLTRLTAKGKVSSIEHRFNVASGEAVTTCGISFYTSTGSASDSTLSIPSLPTATPVQTTRGISLGNHYGEDPSQAAAANWTGHIGNKWIRTRQNLFRTTYPEAFVVDTPRIEDRFRNTTTLSASQSYNVQIPNNAVTITYEGTKKV
jgi:hypothetical protein